MASDKAVLTQLVKRMKSRGSDPLRPLLDEYLLMRDKSEDRLDGWTIDMTPRPRPHGRLSPSSIGGCQRAAVFRYTGTRGTRRIDPDQEMLFEDGNWRHHKWQALFADMEIVLGADKFQLVSWEERIKISRLRVIGSLDAHVRIDGEDLIVDFKGINKNQFDWLVRQDDQRHGHAMQVLPYMRAKRVRRGLVLYDNKDNNLTKAFSLTPDLHGEVWDEVVSWVEEVLDYLRRGRLPQKPAGCTRGSFLYDTCPFRKLCYSRLDNTDLHDLAYDHFSGVDEAWREGQAIERAAGSA